MKNFKSFKNEAEIILDDLNELQRQQTNNLILL